MKFFLTLEQYTGDEELRTLAQFLSGGGGGVKRYGGGIEYTMSREAEAYFTRERIQSLLSKGVRFWGFYLYTPAIPRTTLDNKVPSEFNAYDRMLVSFDEATGEETSVSKQWQEFTHSFDFGADQCFLRVGVTNASGGLLSDKTDNVLLQLFINEFGGFTTKAEFDQIRQDYNATLEI